MEEVAALCTRVGIMVGGRLRCLGSIQHLRDRYGRGYMLEIKVEDVTEGQVSAVSTSMIAALGAPQGAAPEAVMITGSQLPAVAAALGVPERASEVTESGSGWALAASFARSTAVGHAIPVSDAAAWWAGEDSAAQLTAYVTREAFPGAELTERHGSLFRFKVPDAGIPLGVLFARVEAARARVAIRSYSASQTSLEQ